MTDRNGKTTPDPEAELDTLLAQARVNKASPSDDLMERIVDDAKRLQPAPKIASSQVPSLWSQMRSALGGWPAVGGLAATAIVGVYIGFSDPTLVSVPGLAAQDVEISDFFSSETLFTEEGTS